MKSIKNRNDQLKQYQEVNEPYFRENCFAEVQKVYDKVLHNIYDRLTAIENGVQIDDDDNLPEINELDQLLSESVNGNSLNQANDNNEIGHKQPHESETKDNAHDNNDPESVALMMYEELTDLFATARSFNTESSLGEVRAHQEIMQSVFNEFRMAVYKERQDGMQ